MMIVFAADGEIIYVNQEALYELLQYRPSHAEDFKKILTDVDYKRLKERSIEHYEESRSRLILKDYSIKDKT